MQGPDAFVGSAVGLAAMARSPMGIATTSLAGAFFQLRRISHSAARRLVSFFGLCYLALYSAPDYLPKAMITSPKMEVLHTQGL